MVGDLVSELGFEAFDGPKSRLKKRLTEAAVRGVLRQKKRFVSLSCMPTPQFGSNSSHTYVTAMQGVC